MVRVHGYRSEKTVSGSPCAQAPPRWPRYQSEAPPRAGKACDSCHFSSMEPEASDRIMSLCEANTRFAAVRARFLFPFPGPDQQQREELPIVNCRRMLTTTRVVSRQVLCTNSFVCLTRPWDKTHADAPFKGARARLRMVLLRKWQLAFLAFSSEAGTAPV